MPTDEPIGHLDFDPQQCRDAAAGPPIGPAPRGPDWPGPLKPSQKYRSGNGGYHNGGIHFACTCGTEWASIADLISHTIQAHHRGPRDAERMPAT